MLVQCSLAQPEVNSMKTAQRPRRSSFEFGGCGDSHARPNKVGEDAGCPTIASTSRKGMEGPRREGT